MENKVSYAILMSKKIIDSGIYLFKPECLVKGEVLSKNEGMEEVVFKDELGYEYLTISDGELLTTDEETAIGYIIDEQELINQHPDLSLDEAKVEHYQNIANYAHIGFYITKEDKIAVMPIDLHGMADKINNIEIDPNSNEIEIPMSQFKQPEKSELNLEEQPIEQLEKFVMLDLKDLKSIIEIKDLNEMKKTLQTIYDNVNNAIMGDAKNPPLTGKSIIDKFNLIYDNLLSISDIEELKNTIREIVNLYIDLLFEIEEKQKQGYNIDLANNYLYSLVERYDNILKLDDLKLMKKEIANIRKEEQERVESLKIKYDEIEESKKEEIDSSEALLDASKMKEFLDKIIIGQEEAKKDVIAAIIMNKLSDDSTNKNSCLLVGPTGCGKTLIAETVSKYLDVPIEIVDTTQLTMPGYVGANLDDCLVRLLNKTNGDLEKAEQGIVVFDEIDKKGSGKNEDVSGKGVLNTLLPFLQGTTYDINYNKRIYHFNTKNLTVFATGAFTDVAKEKKNASYRGTGIGYNSNTNENSEDIKYEKMIIEDFVKYGNIPVELMGRFTTIAQLSGHTKESLRQILTESDLSALISEQEKLKKLNIELKWTEGYLDAVVEKALKLKTGARSLKSTVEYSIKEARWEILTNLDFYSAIVLTDKTVIDNIDCVLVDKEGNSHNFKGIMTSKEKQKIKLKK